MQQGKQRWRLALALVVIGAAGLATSPPAAGQSESDGVGITAMPRSGRFQNGASLKCLDASQGGAGRDVIQWECHTGANQQWNVVDLGNNYVGLQNRASWQCLEGLGAEHGFDAVQSDCGWGSRQRWYLWKVGTSEWVFENLVTNKCLDASDWGAGVNVYQYTCHSGPNQQWRDIGEPLTVPSG